MGTCDTLVSFDVYALVSIQGVRLVIQGWGRQMSRMEGYLYNSPHMLSANFSLVLSVIRVMLKFA